MGLDDFTAEEKKEESQDKNNDDTESEITEEQAKSTKEFIGVNIRDRAQQSNLDIEVHDGKVTGNLNDVAMLFAVMTMDFTEAQFDELINDEPSDD